MPAQSKLREHAIEPIRALRHIVEEQDRSRPGGSNAYGVPSDATSWVSVPPTSCRGPRPGSIVSRRSSWISPTGAASDTLRRKESRS